MLGILRVEAVVIGVTSGVLSSGLSFAAVLVLARLLHSETVAGLALTSAVLIGMTVGGYVAGRLARINGRFHGSVTALVLAGIVVVVARLGGSPTPIGPVLLLAFAAIVVGGLAGAFSFARARRGT